MLTKIALMAAAAAILVSTAFATFAAPRDQRVPEPIYFSLATGEEG
jgi:hypothetical protein